jgi:hypothetical protein
MAQLVAHHTGSVGVRGSSPLSSTKSTQVGKVIPTWVDLYPHSVCGVWIFRDCEGCGLDRQTPGRWIWHDIECDCVRRP